MYLFFDTETNGLPLSRYATPSQVDNWPRIIQIAFALYGEDEKLIRQESHLIRPDGWTIPKEKFWIDNGFSTEESAKTGVSIMIGLLRFIPCIVAAKYMIAHNLTFDSPIVAAEMIRANLSVESKPLKFCTMNSTRDIVNLPPTEKMIAAGFNNPKPPKLEELHDFLFGCKFDGAHDAGNDVNATAKCFFELKRRGLITLPQRDAK